MKIKLLIAFVVLATAAAFGQGTLAGSNGDCTVGGQQALTQGLPSTATQQIGTSNVLNGAGVQASFPNCSVTVYFTGTLSKASIFSNNLATPTPLTNPFTANNDGSWTFFVVPGACYDIVISTGTGPSLPYSRTWSDICIGTGGGGSGSPGGLINDVQYNTGTGFGGSNLFQFNPVTQQVNISGSPASGAVLSVTGGTTPGTYIQGWYTSGLSLAAFVDLNGNLQINTGIKNLGSYSDVSAFTGGAGSVLSSTGTATSWTGAPSPGQLMQWNGTTNQWTSYFDLVGLVSAPPNPAVGFCRGYFNTTTGLETWINSTGASCGPSGGGGGTITGSGTTNFVPVWTSSSALGNSLLSQFVGTQTGMSMGGTTALTRPLAFSVFQGQPNSACVSGQGIPIVGGGILCAGEMLQSFSTSAGATGTTYGLAVLNISNYGLVVGGGFLAQSNGTSVTELRGVEADVVPQGLVTTVRALVAATQIGSTGTTATDQGLYVKLSASSAGTVVTNTYGVFVDSPVATGTLTNEYGFFLADQTAGGANNPNPHGFWELGAAPNQFGPTTFTGGVTFNITSGATQCAQLTSVGLLQGAGGPCSALTIQTNGTNNLVQNILNNQTSSTNAVGLTVTPTYHTGGAVQYEITGASYTGNANTATALFATPTNCGAGSAAIGILANGNATGCFSPTGLSGLTANGILYATSTTTASSFGPGLIGQIPVSQGTSSPPIMASIGLGGRAVITGASTDLILCDSATSVLDRASMVVYATGSTVTVTMPDAGTSGCGSNFMVTLAVSATNVSGTNYAASTTVTVNNTSSSKFYIINGLSSLSAQTTFNIVTGQYVLISSPDNVNWIARINVPTSLTTNSGSNTVGDLAAWSTATNLVSATEHNVAVPRVCPDSSGSSTAQSCSTTGSPALATNDEIIYTTTTSNTGALTTAVNGGSALSWRKWSGGVLVALVANDIKANEPTLGLFDGTFLIVQSPGNASSGGSSALSSITAATGTATIANAANQINWNWIVTGASGIGLNLGETSASTGGTAGTQAVLGINTATGSTASPLAIVQGTVNGTTNIPGLNLTGTWSNAALGGPLLQVNVTNTSSAAGSCEVEFFAGTSGTTEEFCFATNGNLGSVGGLQALVAGGLTEVTGGLGSTSTAVLAGLLLLKGSDVNSTGAGAKGGGLFAISGGLTNSNPNASALEGLIQLGSQGLKGSAIAAVYDVVCFSATAYTYTDCGTSSLNVAGIASTSANPIGLITMGESPVNSDNAATIGHIFCTSATTAGDGHDNGTVACPYPQVFIGIVKQTAGTVTTYTSGQNTGTQALSTTIPLIQLDVIVPGGCGAQCVLLNAINVGTTAMTLNMSASTSAPSVQLPAVVGGTILAGTSTANLSAPIVIQNTNSTNNNTSITMGITAPGTSTGQTVLNINGATTGGDLQDWGTGGTWTAGVLSGQTIVGSIGPTGILKLGTAPAITAGSGGGIGFSCGTAPTGVASSNTFYCNSANQPDILSGTTDLGIVSTKSQTAQIITADWTCGTGGTVSSCTTAQTIGTLTFTLPLVAANWTFDCNLIVGQATGVTANNWNVQTATNGATNVAAYYSQATAAAAVATGATTGQGSTTTTFNIGGTWTQGATGTKMPVHIWGTIEGTSASGTVFNLQLVAPTVGDLVTIYRGSSCRIY
jgi:hypothetical protein